MSQDERNRPDLDPFVTAAFEAIPLDSCLLCGSAPSDVGAWVPRTLAALRLLGARLVPYPTCSACAARPDADDLAEHALLEIVFHVDGSVAPSDRPGMARLTGQPIGHPLGLPPSAELVACADCSKPIWIDGDMNRLIQSVLPTFVSCPSCTAAADAAAA